MLKIFKPSWIVIEVVHERYTFDTYYTYCRHMSLKEIEDMFMLDSNIREKYRDNNYIYDESGERFEGNYIVYDDYLERQFRLKSYGINYTIVIPAKNRKQDMYFICGNTKNKFGLFDREWINREEETEDSTDE